uniref:Uncharacterized protein n=1 Tax=Fagus sylvatica TaxID=28930 RepID=A0A2N9GY22_FAGSY
MQEKGDKESEPSEYLEDSATLRLMRRSPNYMQRLSLSLLSSLSGFLVSSDGPASHGRADHGGPVAVTMAIFSEQDPHVQIGAEASVRSRNRRTAVLTRPHRCSPSRRLGSMVVVGSGW